MVTYTFILLAVEGATDPTIHDGFEDDSFVESPQLFDILPVVLSYASIRNYR